MTQPSLLRICSILLFESDSARANSRQCLRLPIRANWLEVAGSFASALGYAWREKRKTADHMMMMRLEAPLAALACIAALNFCVHTWRYLRARGIDRDIERSAVDDELWRLLIGIRRLAALDGFSINLSKQVREWTWTWTWTLRRIRYDFSKSRIDRCVGETGTRWHEKAFAGRNWFIGR